MAATSATAEGDIARTPFAHLLIYALDRALSGVIFLEQPDGIEHVIRLSRGVPVKVRPGDRYALLGEMLVEAGAIDEATLTAALGTKSLLGDVLLLAGCVERDVLERTAKKQLIRRIVRLFDVPPATTYRYFDGHHELDDYGCDPCEVDPIALLWAGLREHAPRSTMMASTLAILGEKPMKLHPSATASRFGLDAAEAKLLDHLAAQPATITELVALDAVPSEIVRRFAYAMMIMRQLDTGAGPLPLGASDSSRTPIMPAAPTAVARMQLRSTVHRVGAAAPDLPGAGERDAPIVTARASTRRQRSSTHDARVDDDRAEPPSASPPSSHERLSADAPPTERSSSLPDAPAAKAAHGPAEGARDSGVVEITGAAKDAARDVATTTMRSRRAPSDAEIESSKISAGKSFAELIALARARLGGRDARGALDACDAARELEPSNADAIALGAWIRVQLGRADLKALAVELDELLAADSAHVEARYYRAMVRKRLSDQAGCTSDLRHVLALDPAHEAAKRELAALEPKPAAADRPSLFGRLFKR